MLSRLLARARPRAATSAPRATTLGGVDLRAYDFFDFGAGSGNSLRFWQKRFQAGRGLGIDVSDEKIAIAREKGREVVKGDIRDIPAGTRVRFVSLMDFLEHLPDPEHVRQILGVAVRCARDFVFVRNPSFDDEAYLASLGLRQYWQDWAGHPSHLLLSDFSSLFEELGVPAWTARFKDPIFDSADDSIIPVGAPPDQLRYDAAICGPKPFVRFDKPVFRQIDIVACLSKKGFGEAREILRVAAPR